MIKTIFDYFIQLIFGSDPNGTIRLMGTTIIGIVGWIAFLSSGAMWLWKAFVKPPEGKAGMKVHKYALIAIAGLIIGLYFVSLASGYASDLGSRF